MKLFIPSEIYLSISLQELFLSKLNSEFHAELMSDPVQTVCQNIMCQKGLQFICSD